MSTVVRVAPQATTDLPALRALARALDGPSGGAANVLVLGDDHESGQNAVALAAWLAPQTTGLQIVPEVPVTHTEPFHVATSTATLDHVSRGRAGWSPTAQTTTGAAELTGRRPAAESGAWRELGEVVDVVRRLWTSWEPDAEIRDADTARFIDRDKVHYVDAEITDSAGETYSVKGPSTVPRPPQGELPTLLPADDPASGEVVQVNDSAEVLAAASRFGRGRQGEP
ncbi:LLM class flavin-dependent oxidoreductase [Corynebacteriaceae bacterium 7-707]